MSKQSQSTSDVVAQYKPNGTSIDADGTSSVGERVQIYANNARDTAEQLSNRAAESGRNLLDRFSTPEQREEIYNKVRDFASTNPKLSAFLGLNLVLSGVPLLLFILFSVGTLVTSVIVALLVALVAAVSFTLFSVGVALLILLPTVFFTTAAATFLFFWGVVGFFILRWATSEADTDNNFEGRTIGDKLNNFTGGRLDRFVGQAKDAKSEAKSQAKGAQKQIEGQAKGAKNEIEGQVNKANGRGNTTDAKGKVEQAAKNTFGADNVDDTLNGRVPRSVVETTESVKKEFSN